MNKRFILITAIFLPTISTIRAVQEVSRQAKFKTDEVNICVDIHSNIYIYKITNLSTSSIIGFESKQHAAYNFILPEGWEKETSSGIFRMWATKPNTGIHTNQTAQLSIRVSSKGAVLGSAPVKIKFESGKTIFVSNVLVPVPEPRSHIALIATLILIVISARTIILNRKNNSKKLHINDA